MANTTKLHSTAQERYLAEARRVGCSRYDPCPICFKCRIKASHLFLKCEICQVPFDQHSEKDRNFMIRRENFAIKQEQLGPDAIEAFRALSRKLESTEPLVSSEPIVVTKMEGEVADAARRFSEKARRGDWVDPDDPSARRLSCCGDVCACGKEGENAPDVVD